MVSLSRAAALISAALLGSALALDPICVNVRGPNFVTNPGFDSGSSRWNQIPTGSGGLVETGEQADGTNGPYWRFLASTTSRSILQSMSGATAGTEYALSINYQGYIPPTSTVSSTSCTIRLVIVESGASRTVLTESPTLSKDAQPWRTAQVSFVPATSAFNLQIIETCSVSGSAAGIQMRFDNIFIGTSTLVCTQPSSTQISSTQISSTQISSTQISSTQISSTQVSSTVASAASSSEVSSNSSSTSISSTASTSDVSSTPSSTEISSTPASTASSTEISSTPSGTGISSTDISSSELSSTPSSTPSSTEISSAEMSSTPSSTEVSSTEHRGFQHRSFQSSLNPYNTQRHTIQLRFLDGYYGYSNRLLDLRLYGHLCHDSHKL
ncbi:unnamed protein product [Clonostachys solani]|uniref:CBM-cenC domain-containing protein n=1 Tax=Clonostachys solani TaxID=160281 RepID=A0A9N9W6G4_9HYPO|nr:unnamed protein product [Clonostachys solani]